VRIVAGAWRGRRIHAPEGDSVRPTGDRVREAWMSILGSAIPEARVLDLFAGSGALGLEALSRGAASAQFVEESPTSLAAIRKNATLLGAGDRAVIHRGEALAFVATLEAGAFDIAFADPPYAKLTATKLAQLWLTRPFAAILGVEHHRDERLPDPGVSRKYGDTVITFYRTESTPADRAIISADSIADSES
jgi:16S rRNA (guanine966-N2)-methyltransferase